MMQVFGEKLVKMPMMDGEAGERGSEKETLAALVQTRWMSCRVQNVEKKILTYIQRE